MGKIIVVMGTPGAGKTSVLKALNPKYKIISMGTEMFKLAKSGAVQDRDDMKEKLTPTELKRLRNEVLAKIAKEDGDIFIDTHTSLKKGDMFIPAFSTHELKVLNGLKAFIYIDADADEILIRRLKDKTRDRDIENTEEIDQHRNFNISLIAAFVAELNVPFFLVENHQSTREKSTATIEKVAEEMFSD